MILRPYGVVIHGQLELGLELQIYGGEIAEVRPHTGIPEPFVVSAAFVNAHSHLEYRGLLGVIREPEYWGWIREITRQKQCQTPEEVRRDCLIAAEENRATGVALIAEHSDRVGSGEAIAANGLKGMLFQEVITFFERENREEKLHKVRQAAADNAKAFSGPIEYAPHAYQTVDRQTLWELAGSGRPLSIHVAETWYETEFTRDGAGPIAEFHKAQNVPFTPTGKPIVATLDDLGLVRPGVQFVHCCALEEGDIERLAVAGVVIAHCPRSNTRLRCPAAPVREMLDAGIPVGLGLDSAASSGPIDMFDEMREAERVSLSRGRALKPEEIWWMATGGGAQSLCLLGVEAGLWDVAEGSRAPLIKVHVEDAFCTEDLMLRGRPELVEWI